MTTSNDTTTPPRDTFLLGGDLPVRRIGLGAMRLTDATGDGTHAGAQIWRASSELSGATALLRRAVNLGVQLIDTADAYALGQNEELIAASLYPYPDDLVVATKVGNTRPSPDIWVPLGHPAYLQQQVELSLRRLRRESIDLLQLHRIDPYYPLPDQIGALADLREAGKIRHIGLSEVTVDELRQAQGIAPIAAVQNLYNLAARNHDAVVDYAATEGIAFLPFFPLATGDLAREGSAVATIAHELAVTPSQVAMSWLLHRSPTILPIPGTTSIDHLEENMAAARIVLSADDLQRIAATL